MKRQGIETFVCGFVIVIIFSCQIFVEESSWIQYVIDKKSYEPVQANVICVDKSLEGIGNGVHIKSQTLFHVKYGNENIEFRMRSSKGDMVGAKVMIGLSKAGNVVRIEPIISSVIYRSVAFLLIGIILLVFGAMMIGGKIHIRERTEKEEVSFQISRKVSLWSAFIAFIVIILMFIFVR